MTIKMVATDIDGTILKYTNSGFTQEVINCIHELNKGGIKIVLVTGRMNQSAQKIADELGLKTAIVSYQGGLVWDNDKILNERYLPADKAEKILKWGKKHNTHINLYMNDELYVTEENEFTHKYADAQNIKYHVGTFDKLHLEKVNKILFIDYNEPEKITRITSELQKEFPELYIVKSADTFCEVCHKEATKGNGLKCIQDFYGITKEETLTIGDHNNDIELLMSGGIKVAMGNATDELKAVADYITDTVDNNGFVKAMEKFVKAGANV